MKSWVIRMDVPNIKVCYRRSPYKPSLPCCSLGYSLGYSLSYSLGYSSWVTHRVLLTVLPVALRTVLFVAVLFTAIRGTYIVANTFTRLCLLGARSGVFWTTGIYWKNSWKCSTAALAPEHAEHPPSISSRNSPVVWMIRSAWKIVWSRCVHELDVISNSVFSAKWSFQMTCSWWW